MSVLNKEFSLTEQDFSFLSEFIHQRTGIVINDNKKDLLYSRLAKRLRQLNITSFSKYCDLLQASDAADEVEHLINSITTNLTHFFREKHHFDHLAELLPSLVSRGEQKIRIWSSACSSGQEPYSIAMVVVDKVKNWAELDIKILATDIDTMMLDKCKKGLYTDDEVKNLPSGYLEKFFSQVNDKTFQVHEQLKKLIQFNHLNLLESWPLKGKFHIIFCRNVAIYFDKDTQKMMFSKMADVMVEGGYLYIGHSENLNQLSDQYTLIGKTLYQKI
jgi:chemotaxis protein methyltransferase CheR